MAWRRVAGRRRAGLGDLCEPPGPAALVVVSREAGLRRARGQDGYGPGAQARRPSRPGKRTSSGGSGLVSAGEPNMHDAVSKPALASAQGSSRAAAPRSSVSSCPVARARSQAWMARSAVSCTTYSLPGGVAEGQVHGPVEGSGLRHRRVRLLDRGGQQARPRRRVIAHEVALEPVAGLPDGQAFQQRRHPRGTNVGTLLPGGGDVLVSHSVTSRASAGLDTP